MKFRIYHYLKRLLSKINLGFMVLIFPRDFEQDGVATSRVRPFENDDEFIHAKRDTVKLIGEDFGIDWRSHVFLWAFNSTLGLPGTAIELGTGRAWMFTFALCSVRTPSLGDVLLIDRFSSFYVDKVSGVPVEGAINPIYNSSVGDLRNRFEPERGVEIVQGELPGVLLELEIESRRFIHVDLNAAEPEVNSLRILWDRLNPGAMVLLDDFGSPEFTDSNLAMKRLAQELSFDILGLPTGQGLIIKR